jgi:selenocysteine-specific elongation factor
LGFGQGLGFKNALEAVLDDHRTGFDRGVVALTKADAVDAETLELAQIEIEEKLAASSLKGAPVVPCSGLTGEGLDELVAELDRVVAVAPPAPDHERPRLWVDRVFTIAGAGTVVTGTLAGGSFAVGDEVEIAPESRRARIRTIQSHKKEVTSIAPGNRTALNLAGLERQGAERGDAVVKSSRWRATAMVDASIRVLPEELSGFDHDLTEKGAHLLYVGSAETPVRIRLLDTDALSSGDSGFAQLYLRDPLPLYCGDRFVLRDAGRVLTFGGGEVLDPLPPRARRQDRTKIELLTRLQAAEPEDALRALVESEGALSRDNAELRSGSRKVPDGIATLADLLISESSLVSLAEQVRDALSAYHRDHPLEKGMPREALRAVAGLDPEAFDALMEVLDGVVEEGAAVRLESFTVELSDAQRQARDRVLSEIEAGDFSPPPAKELAVDQTLLRMLAESGELVRIGDFFITRRQAGDARARVRKMIEERGPVTVAEIRDLLGTSRKYAVPLCEWLDETGATLRRGDQRLLGPNP